MNVVLLTSALLEHLLLGEQRACIPHGAFYGVFSTVKVKHWKSMVKTLRPTSACDLGGLHVP